MFQIFVQLVVKRHGLGGEQIFFGGLVGLKKSDVLFINPRNHVLNENNEKRILCVVLSLRDACTRFELAFFHKWIGQAGFYEPLMGLQEGIV